MRLYGNIPYEKQQNINLRWTFMENSFELIIRLYQALK
jgi:hypothetical protein